MFKYTLSLSLCAILSASLQANTLTLEPMNVASGSIETNELQAPFAVEIYTKQDLEKVHARNVYEFLNQATSITTLPNYGNPFSQKIDMHGYGNDGHQNIVIMLNGRRLNNIDGTPSLLSSIPLNAISRIEISKGSGIVGAGDGANAGVINIFTDSSDASSLTLYGGTYHTFDGAFNVNQISDTLRFNLAGEAYKNGGIRTVNTNGNKDKSALVAASFSLAYTPVSEVELRLGSDFSNMSTIYGGTMTQDEYHANPTQQGSVDYGWGPSPSSSSEQKFSTRSINTGLSVDVNQALSINVDGYHEIKKSNYITYNSVANYTYDTAKAYVDYRYDTLSIRTGIEGFSGERTHNTSILEKKNLAAYATGSYGFGDETVSLGYRIEKVNYDNKIDLDKNENLHGVEAGFNYRFSKEQSVFASFSHAYQTADIDRLFSYTTGAFMGYVNPMKSDTYTVGYNHISPNNKLKISAFYANLNDEIYYYADPAYTNSKNTNIDKSHKYGLDFYDQLILSDQLGALLNYNYVQAIIDDEMQNGDNYAGKKLPGVSNHTIKASLSYLPTPAANFVLTQVYRSSAYAADDFNNNFTQKQEAYTSTNLAFTYTQKEYEIFAKINNLFNQANGIWVRDDAIYPIDFTTTAIAGVKFIF
jgi:iron complex outermembrane receptor protein